MKQLILLLLVALSLYASAQIDGQSYPIQPDPLLPMLVRQAPSQQELKQGKGHLDLDLDATGFFYDVENNLPFAKGYTATGIRLSPTLLYGLNDRTQLRAGVNATMLAGCDSLHELRPIISITYSPCKQLTLVAGSLYGNLAHRLDGPLYDPQRWVYHHLEEGIQILTDAGKWRSDTWIDWWHYLVPNTPDQEYFTFGTDHTLNLFHHRNNSHLSDISYSETGSDTVANRAGLPNHGAGWDIDLPATFMAHHRGGELKTIDTTTLTHFQERVGLRVSRTLMHNRKTHFATQQWTLDVPIYVSHFSNHSSNGYALYPNLIYTMQHERDSRRRQLTIRGGYWYGDGYLSYFGLPEFQSTAPLAPTVDATRRNMLTFALVLEHGYHHNSTQIGISAQCYYDLDFRQLDVTFGLYLKGNKRFRLH